MVDKDREHKKAKRVNRYVVATLCHDEYKDVLLNNKSLRHSMNRIQSKNYMIETYEISKISLYLFGDKMHTRHNGHDGSALGYQS